MAIKAYSYAKDGNRKLSANFAVKEFRCKDGSDPIFIDDELVTLLQKIRDHFGKSVTITSAYRTAAHNKAVKGATYSQHCYGKAADIRVQGGGSYCMCSNLIFYNAGVTHGTDKFAGTSGCSGSNDLIFILINFFSQGSNDFFGSAHRISLGPEIDSGEDIFFFIDNDTFGGNRSDVNS